MCEREEKKTERAYIKLGWDYLMQACLMHRISCQSIKIQKAESNYLRWAADRDSQRERPPTATVNHAGQRITQHTRTHIDRQTDRLTHSLTHTDTLRTPNLADSAAHCMILGGRVITETTLSSTLCRSVKARTVAVHCPRRKRKEEEKKSLPCPPAFPPISSNRFESIEFMIQGQLNGRGFPC